MCYFSTQTVETHDNDSWVRTLDREHEKYLPLSINLADRLHLSEYILKKKKKKKFVRIYRSHPLRKHAYSNILKIIPPKHENFQIKKFW